MVNKVLRDAGVAKIVGWREWVSGMVRRTVDIFAIGGRAANAPESPLAETRGRIYVCAWDLGNIGGEEEGFVERW